MSSSATTTGRWPRRWRSRSCCCWWDRSRSTSTTTCGSSRPERGMSERRAGPALLTVLFLGIAILYVPIVVLIGYSFNASPLVNVWGGFSTAWYGRLLHNRQLLEAALLSLEVAVTASSGAVVLGTLAAVALVRFARFRGRLLLTGMVNAPLVMPEIITGITQLLLFVSMFQMFAWPHRGFTTIVISHVFFFFFFFFVVVFFSADRGGGS